MLGTKVDTGTLPFLLVDTHAKDEMLTDFVAATALTPGRAAYLDAIPAEPLVDTFAVEAPAPETPGDDCGADFLTLHRIQRPEKLHILQLFSLVQKVHKNIFVA